MRPPFSPFPLQCVLWQQVVFSLPGTSWKLSFYCFGFNSIYSFLAWKLHTWLDDIHPPPPISSVPCRYFGIFPSWFSCVHFEVRCWPHRHACKTMYRSTWPLRCHTPKENWLSVPQHQPSVVNSSSARSRILWSLIPPSNLGYYYLAWSCSGLLHLAVLKSVL